MGIKTLRLDKTCGAMKAETQSQKAAAAKAALRMEVRSALAGLTVEQKAVASEAACRKLTDQSIWQKAQSILFFAPRLDELDIWPLLGRGLAEKKAVLLPKYVAESQSYTACQVYDLVRDISPGKFNLREPAASFDKTALNWLDLILVPGVAFDLHGRRLGRGKGFYDQLLKTMRGTMCGVAFDEQIVREVPIEPHDIYLNCLLTPTRWIEL